MWVMMIISYAFVSIIDIKSFAKVKCGSYFIIIVISLLVLLAFLTIPNIKPEKLLPIMGNVSACLPRPKGCQNCLDARITDSLLPLLDY